MSETELLTIIYCYIDEVCGNFVFSLDENFFLTTSIELNIINQKETKNFLYDICDSNNIKNKENGKLICKVEISGITKEGRKIDLRFQLFKFKDFKFVPLLDGKAKFQKPKQSLPMSLGSKF
jgi:hypothetical protein